MTRDSIRSVVLNKVKGKGKSTRMWYILIDFSHTLMVREFENIPGIRGYFVKALGEKIPRMLLWASVDLVMFGQVKQALIGSKDEHVRLSTTFDSNSSLICVDLCCSH